ncbi:hypothetical protein DLE04_04890 [Actinobacteria bacterium IMCC26103]|nr:hypothetical protein DLE04_04890 [Actinobacteria bacterium IMCC26103]
MFIALVVFSSYLTFKDLRTHRIANKSLLLGLFGFAALSCIQGSSIHPKSLLISALVAPIFLKFRLGAGDVKLLFLLSTFFLPSSLVALLKFLTALSAISTLLIFLHTVGGRSLRSEIAFAPAICGAVIWCAK